MDCDNTSYSENIPLVHLPWKVHDFSHACVTCCQNIHLFAFHRRCVTFPMLMSHVARISTCDKLIIPMVGHAQWKKNYQWIGSAQEVHTMHRTEAIVHVCNNVGSQ